VRETESDTEREAEREREGGIEMNKQERGGIKIYLDGDGDGGMEVNEKRNDKRS
jgi:hypothetical protein